jgi:hypothetical protein
VVEAASEGPKELLGGVELAAGSAVSGNNRRRLPPARCSQRKLTTGEHPLPGFASRCCGQVLGAGGAWYQALLLVRSDNSEAAGNGGRSGGRCGAEQRRAAVELWEGGVKRAVASCGDVRVQGLGGHPTWGSNYQWPPVPSGSPCGEHGHWE